METPTQLLYKLNTYSQNFTSILDDFSNSYINYKLYPDYTEYENIYSNHKSNLDSLQADVFIATNDVQKNIDTLNSLINDLNIKLNTEKDNNKILKNTLSQISSDGNGSELLFSESKDLYKMQKIYNIILISAIFLIIFLLFKVYF